MRKIILLLAVTLSVIACNATNKDNSSNNNNTTQLSQNDKIVVTDLGNFKLHAYAAGDALGNMTHIIEGPKALVVVEPAAFYENIEELGVYINSLNKPVEKVLALYHAAGFSGFDASKFVMIEGMPQFIGSDSYQGMMGFFASTFGDALDQTPAPANVATVANNEQVEWDGISFKFTPGASSDYPASSVMIGGKVYYIHFTPVANMHMGATQLNGRESVSAYLAELENAKATGAIIFIGGHGGASADVATVDFQIAYLKKANSLLIQQDTAEGFVSAMMSAYPSIAGEEGLEEVAAALYK